MAVAWRQNPAITGALGIVALALLTAGGPTVASATAGALDASFGAGGITRTNFSWGPGAAARAMLRLGDGRLVVAGDPYPGDSAFVLVRYLPNGDLDQSFGDRGRAMTVTGPNYGGFTLGAFGLIEAEEGAVVVAGRASAAPIAQIALARYTADGRLDPDFGANGVVTTAITTGYDFVSAIGRDADGRLIVVGHAYDGTAFDILVARYLANGDLDLSFGTGGHRLVEAGGWETIHGLAVLDDGALVIAGTATVSTSADVLVVRLAADGSLDPSFGIGGVVRTDLGADEEARSLAVAADGSLLVAGVIWGPSYNSSDLLVMRYRPEGTLDATFGAGGVVVTSLTPSDIAYALTARGDGGLLVAGSVAPTGLNREAVLLRYLPDGRLDPTFGSGGSVRTSFTGPDNEAYAVLQQPDGKAIIAGLATNPNNDRFVALARFDDAGGLDSSFGDGGTVRTAANGSTDELKALAVQSDGRLVAAGTTFNGSSPDLAIARYHPDGSLDPTFGVGGTVVVGSADGAEEAGGVVVQDSGHVVVSARFYDTSSVDVGLVRLQPDGSLDTSFGNDGRLIMATVGPAEYASDLVLQDDGKMVLVGSATAAGGSTFLLVRYLADGTLDPGFGSGGVVTGSVPGVATAGLQQADGKLVAVGSASGFTTLFAMARWNADGSPDTTFGAGGRTYLSATGTTDQILRAVAQQADGRLLAAGGNTVVRSDAAGTNPFASVWVGRGPVNHFAIAEQPDGRLIGAGEELSGYIRAQFALARYGSTGSLDPTFGAGGSVTTRVGAAGSQVGALQVQPDTRIVAAGSASGDFALARYFTQACGNGSADAGEQCDDGNLSGGDCCSPDCAFETAGSACSGDGIDCTDDRCDGAGACQHPPAAVGAICRAAAGDCDVEERCDGAAGACPADAWRPATTPCRPSAGECDLVEQCDGASPQCPVDAKRSSVCRAAVDLCDLEERCDGSGDACPVDRLAAPAAPCRPAAGACDAPELCDGSSTACPSDAKLGGECRAASGPCDVAERCDGASDGCPADVAAADGTSCSDGAFCNGDERCLSGTCQPDAPPCPTLCDEAADACVTGCAPAPRACRAAATSSLLIRADRDGATDRLVWRWVRGASTSLAELADPTATTEYALCLYAGTPPALRGGVTLAAGSPAWRPLGTQGYRFDAPAGSSGIDRVLLKGSDRDRAKILLKGSGAGVPSVALPLDAPVALQLVNGDSGVCWGADYGAADLLRSDATQLKARRR